MKFSIYLLSLIFLIGLSSLKDLQSTKVVNFNVRGNGKTNVSLGIGYQVGSGACCRGVSKESTVGFQGNPGDVLYDSETKRVILKVYEDLEGKTVDLRQYY